ncbi:hypothetical protein B0H67DRAFT_582285 [Lasiosphaeris hirsuta]|uniref:Extracellular membrane protein CFEM domain-containing protein n=1 Tax=Lasiosphaeris hirsuta TaxID=260670 RepID=A0AA40AHQ9_9PEZI|nr:hypothetical protein B0H67DRAFT_582285 [Lasiosphaeris hirsuta]
MQTASSSRFLSLGILLLLLRPEFCNAQTDDVWEFCPGVEHANCDAALKTHDEACAAGDIPGEDPCNCSQRFINSYVNCQAELTLCTGDTVIKPSEWTDLFAFWEQRCAAVISSQSITIPKPTRTVSPGEKSKAPLASCDAEGGANRGAACTQAQLSASSCFSTTADATNTLGAFPCLCNAGLLELMDECGATENFVKCGGSTTSGEVPWPTRLRSTCRSFGLNPDLPATSTGKSAVPPVTITPGATFAALGPTSVGTSGTVPKTAAWLSILLLEGCGLFLASLIFLVFHM